MRRFLCVCIAMWLLGIAVAANAQGARPNVLFIAIDDLNDWIGAMGGHPQAYTPNIDRLAARGLLFTNAHCQAPICGPSRASLMSGLLPSTTGIYGQISSKHLAGNPAISKTRYVSNYFADHGYKTMAVGKIFHGDGGVDAFDEYGGKLGGVGPKPPNNGRINYTPPDNPWGPTQTDWGAYPDADEQMPDTMVAQWAVERLGQKHDKPFFLAVGFWRPHVPLYVPQKWFTRFPLQSVENPPLLETDMQDLPAISLKVHEMPMMPPWEWMKQEDRIRQMTQAYLACIEFVDSRVGMVLDALDKSPHAGNTIVVLWTDHGYHMGEKQRWAKHSLWEESTHVPLIISTPDRRSAGSRCDAPVGLIDMYPTLVELAGLPANARNEGRSLVPLLKDPSAKWDHPALTTYGRDNHSARDRRYRYIRYEDGSEELYDHAKDPQEWQNAASDNSLADVKQRLAAAFPKVNAPWYTHSHHSTNAYFDDHIKRHSRP